MACKTGKTIPGVPALPRRSAAAALSEPHSIGTVGCWKSLSSSLDEILRTTLLPSVVSCSTRCDLPPGPKSDAFTAGIRCRNTFLPGPSPSSSPTFHCRSGSGGPASRSPSGRTYFSCSVRHRFRCCSGGSSQSSIGVGCHSFARRRRGCPHRSCMSCLVATTITRLRNCGVHKPRQLSPSTCILATSMVQ